MAKGKDPDAKLDAAQKKAGKPDKDTPQIAALEKRLGVGGATSPTPGKAFGAGRRTAPPVPGPSVRTQKPPVGFGSDSYPKKGGTSGGYPKKNKAGGARD